MKYPRTLHVPFSPGIQNDDRISEYFDSWDENEEIIVTEKLDGEACAMLSSKIHARSEDSLHHQSRNYVKSKWGTIRHLIPKNIQLNCENVYAKHSIFYPNLTDFYYLISVFDLEKNIVMSFDDCIYLSKFFHIPFTPIIYIGPLKFFDWKLPEKSEFGPEIEGYVVRKSREFYINEFHMHIVKFVRKGHVQTKDHWLKTWKPNKIIKL